MKRSSRAGHLLGVRGDQEPDATRSAAFVELYEGHFDAVSTFALRRSSPEGAADAVSETFVVAWRRLDDIPPGPETRLWLFGVTRRVLANQRRSGVRQDQLRRRLAHELAAWPVAAVEPSAPDDLAKLRRAFRRLPDSDRELLSLVGWEGLSPTDVSKVVAVPASVVRVRLHRARRRLAKLLSTDDPVDLPLARSRRSSDSVLAWEEVR